MASSAVACQAKCGGLHSTGPQLRTLKSQAAESFTLLSLERCRIGPSLEASPAAGWRHQKRRAKLGVVMTADLGQSTFPPLAALSLPFGKNAAAGRPAEPETQMHVVQRGQVMSKIAQLYETDLKTLHELNPGVALDYVRPKQTIVVPKLRAVATAGAAKGMDVPGICPPKGKAPPSKASPRQPVKVPAQSTPAAVAETGAVLDTITASGELQYVVQSGDSLFTIAERYGVSMTELVKLNKLHFKSTILPQQTLRIPANSKPQAAIVASVCPAPPPTCPVPSRKPQTGWAIGVGLALLGAAAAAYAYDLMKGKKLAAVEETQPPLPAAGFASPLAASTVDNTKTDSLQAAEIIAAVAAPRPTGETPVVPPPAEAAANPVVADEASVAQPPAAVAPPPAPVEAVAPPPSVSSPTATPLDPIVASTPAAETEATPAPLAPTELPAPSLPEAASADPPTPMAAPEGENGRAVKAPMVVLTSVTREAEKQQPELVKPEASASAVTVDTAEAPVPEVIASAVIEEAEVTPSLVIEDKKEAQNGAAAVESVVSAHKDEAASETSVSLTDILPDGLVPLETTDIAEKQPQPTDGQLGVGSSFCQEATITRALQGAYRAASQSLGPLHQTLAFVALSSGRIGLASEDFTWGSTAEAVVALRSTLPADCNLQGICTWGITGADGNGAGEEKEKEWAAVLLFSAQGRVVANGSTITTGSPRLAAEMAAEGLRAKAVGKKLKAVIIVSSPQTDAAAIDVVRDVIPGLPVYAISESKVPDSPGRPVALSKEWQVAPAGATSAVAPGISLVGITTEADFGGAFFATVVGQWLYGPKCTIEALPSTAKKEMATSGR
ncbi:hypothetical protein KFL_004670040 [Klebsormidium nitens]|uniref:LysM domain-containing protein n=1 Tax=Klebsormidium nitens TaxID=105231 RepID=A0A0U9HKJ1_KLENI|nr:hypothetical protein KFL_004670040 [Klebsormidium nitens]|eukprot:GAQ88887.1 hypothetical protein KFL_004670040 [Klebsormidium nitens]